MDPFSEFFSASERGDTAQASLIQVGTPSLGSSHRFSTNQATTTPIGIKASTIFLLSGMIAPTREEQIRNATTTYMPCKSNSQPAS
jgi:hypothetical protein